MSPGASPVPGLRPRLTLVLGGARSGKSRFAESRIEASGLDPVYIATGRAFDPEMEARIGLHRSRRGPGWTVVEAPVDLLAALRDAARPGAALLVDCLTLWITNLMLEDRAVDAEGDALVSGLAEDLARGLPSPLLFVSNEVGLGIVPDNAMARAFRDHAGRLHQSIAQISDTVIFIAAGLPLTLKG